MKSKMLNKIIKKIRNMMDAFEERFGCVDVDALDDEEDDDAYLYEDEEYYDNLGINKYQITFDFEVPADEAEDSIKDLKHSFFRKMEKAFAVYGAELDNLTINPVREYDLGEFEEVPALTVRDVIDYFKSKKGTVGSESAELQVPLIDLKQTQKGKESFTVISGGKDTVNL